MAQELLRHSDIRLTMNTYTKLKLEGLSNAVNALPDIGGDDPEGHELQQTGTCAEVWGAENGAVIGTGLQELAGTQSHAQSNQPQWGTKGNTARTPANRERKQPQSCADRGCHKAGDRSRTDDVQLGKLTFYH